MKIDGVVRQQTILFSFKSFQNSWEYRQSEANSVEKLEAGDSLSLNIAVMHVHNLF
jgi:hypothetical protein